MTRFSDRPRTGDWMKLNCGDTIREIIAPKTEEREEELGRHVGVVRAIHHGAFVIVKWEDSGWISQLPLASVRKIKDSHEGEDE